MYVSLKVGRVYLKMFGVTFGMFEYINTYNVL